MFRLVKLKAMFPLVLDGANNMINYIKRELLADNKKTFEARDITARYTCDVSASCILASDAQSFLSENPEIYELGKNILAGIANSVLSIFPKKFVPKNLENDFIKLMADAIKHRMENRIDRDDFLAHIIAVKLKKAQTDVEAAAHGWTFFLDSFETSAIVCHLALYQIANNKKVQEKLRDEINENLDEDGTLSYEKLTELPYLDQVFYEVLRLHPPFMYTTKVCSENLELDAIKGHKYMMKKGSTALISLHSIHRDPGKTYILIASQFPYA